MKSEYIHLDNFVKRLEEVGWVNGTRYVIGFREREVLPSYLIDGVVKDSIRRINDRLLRQFSAADRDLIVNKAFNALSRAVSPEDVLDYLRGGVPVNISVSDRGSWSGRIMLVDYDNSGNNVFFYLKHPRFIGLSTREPDLVLYINGIPVVVIEVKDPTKPNSYREALKQIRVYERELPTLFSFIQIGVAIGDDEYYTPTLPGSINTRRDAYRWIAEGENSSDVVKLLRPATLLEFIRYFIYFRTTSYGSEKIVARYNQYYAVKAIMKRAEEYLRGLNNRNRGLIWHWQGSGKTYIMFFAAKMFIDKYYKERPLVFIVVDRRELEDQINKMLGAIKDQQFSSMFKRINSIEELHEALKIIKMSEWNPNIIPSPTIYLVTIQKFRSSNEELEGIDSLLRELGSEYLSYLRENNRDKYAKIVAELDRLDSRSKEEALMKLGSISKRHILVLIDEAHRSQYGILASMLRIALPNAIMIGFTGTPVFKYDRNTIKEFAYPGEGELYLHAYSISDSIRDGFTVPIIYRVVVEGKDIVGGEGFRVNLNEDEIKEILRDYEDCIEREGDCEKVIQEARISRIVLQNPRRIEKVAEYIVNNLENDLGCDPANSECKFKAMVVAVNRRACVYYKRYLDEYLREKYGDRAKDWVEVVMTYQVNDPEEIARYKEELYNRFGKKDVNEINREITDRFREGETPKILVVTDMLLAGFDAPNLKVLYLDKPLFEHRLLQAMTRVNRPFKTHRGDEEVELKGNGIIVDFIGLIKHLTRSMMLYEMLAKENPQRILEEFRGGAVKDVESEFNEFVSSLKDIKDRLKQIRLGLEEVVSIDVDELVEVLKRRGRVEVRNLLNDVASKLAMFATDEVYEEYPDESKWVRRLLNDITKIIRMYRSLGTYPDKLKYEDDVKVLSILYGLVITKMNRSDVKIDLETLKKRLFEYIFDNTIVEDLTKVTEIKIDEKELDRLGNIASIGKTFETTSSDVKWVRAKVEDLILQLRGELSSRPADPIYKALYLRLMDVVKRWVSRRVDIIEAIKELKSILVELRKYEESVANQPVSARVAYALNKYISENYLDNKPVSLKLENTRKVIDKAINRGMPLLDSDIREIKTKLLQDILKELGNVLSSETKNRISRDLDRIVNDIIRQYIERYTPNSGANENSK